MLWVVAFFVTIVAVMVGIGRWKNASDPLHALDEKNRKVWEKESGEELVYESHNCCKDSLGIDYNTDPSYASLGGNIHHNDD